MFNVSVNPDAVVGEPPSPEIVSYTFAVQTTGSPGRPVPEIPAPASIPAQSISRVAIPGALIIAVVIPDPAAPKISKVSVKLLAATLPVSPATFEYIELILRPTV